jgi:hypothetical protein
MSEWIGRWVEEWMDGWFDRCMLDGFQVSLAHCPTASLITVAPLAHLSVFSL